MSNLSSPTSASAMSLGGHGAVSVPAGETCEGAEVFAVQASEATTLTDVEAAPGAQILTVSAGVFAPATTLEIGPGVTWLRLAKFTPSAAVIAYIMDKQLPVAPA